MLVHWCTFGMLLPFSLFLRLLGTLPMIQRVELDQRNRSVNKRSNLPNPMRFKTWLCISKLPSIEVNYHTGWIIFVARISNYIHTRHYESPLQQQVQTSNDIGKKAIYQSANPLTHLFCHPNLFDAHDVFLPACDSVPSLVIPLIKLRSPKHGLGTKAAANAGVLINTSALKVAPRQQSASKSSKHSGNPWLLRWDMIYTMDFP